MPLYSKQAIEGPIGSRDSAQWDGSIQESQLLGYGSAGMVFELDDARVVKIYHGEDGQRVEDMETERQAYRNLQGSGICSPHVLQCYNHELPDGLVLERCVRTVRRWVRSRQYAPQKEALRLAVEAAKGLASVHLCGIIQGDGWCHCAAHGSVILKIPF